MSISTDDFIKNLYLIDLEELRGVTGSRLAKRLNVSGAAITDMARKLSKRGLIKYQPYKALELSAKGRKMALKIVRKHRLWELFLHKVLKMDLLEIHDEAERLEHNTSDRLADRLWHFLGEPKFDPHGDPIPLSDGQLPPTAKELSLADTKQGNTYQLSRLQYRSSEIFNFYKRHGLAPGVRFTTLQKYSFDGSVEIEVDGRIILLSESLTANIFCSE